MAKGEMTYYYFILCLPFVYCSQIHVLKQSEYEHVKMDFGETMISLCDESCKIKPCGINASVNSNIEREHNVSRATKKSLSKRRILPNKRRDVVKQPEVDSDVSSQVKSFNSNKGLAHRAHHSELRPEKHGGNMAVVKKTTTYSWENLIIPDDKMTIDNISEKITKSETTTELSEIKRLSKIDTVETKTDVDENETVRDQNINKLIGDSSDSFELQCFGCNGEIMLDFSESNVTGVTGLRTMFTLKSNVFELVRSSHWSLKLWTPSRSPCDSQSFCDDCNRMVWFEKRQDGICRRLYIYYLAMEVGGIAIDFVRLNKMSHFMVKFLKSHLAFDVLEEWWPPWVVFDARLNTHLYTARLLVYDVHRASVHDAVKQIRNMSIVTYAYRHRCNVISQESKERIHIKYDLRSSFDLGRPMKKALDLYNMTQMSNRSTCVCKIIFLATKVKYTDVERICHLGCFPETFNKLDAEWVGNLISDCFETYYPTEEKNYGYRVTSQFIFGLFLFVFCVYHPCLS